MKAWKRFLKDTEGATQLFIVGPMLKHIYNPIGPTVFVDGGATFRGTVGVDGNIPTVSVGDGDSGEALLEVSLPSNKDYSDLAFVLRSIPAHIRHLEMIGFLGGRRDHELIGFGEVHRFLKTKTEFTTVRFEEAVVAFSAGRLKLNIEGRFSVGVFEETNVTITGACQFPLNAPTVLEPMSSHGLSNSGRGPIVICSDKPCFVFLS